MKFYHIQIISLTNDEGPNPKTLLSQSSRRTKAQLNRIGVFTVSSLHGKQIYSFHYRSKLIYLKYFHLNSIQLCQKFTNQCRKIITSTKFFWW